MAALLLVHLLDVVAHDRPVARLLLQRSHHARQQVQPQPLAAQLLGNRQHPLEDPAHEAPVAVHHPNQLLVVLLEEVVPVHLRVVLVGRVVVPVDLLLPLLSVRLLHQS